MTLLNFWIYRLAPTFVAIGEILLIELLGYGQVSVFHMFTVLCQLC